MDEIHVGEVNAVTLGKRFENILSYLMQTQHLYFLFFSYEQFN